MKNYEETIQTVLERIHKKTAQKKRRRKTVIQTAVYLGCLCLVLLMGAGIWQSRLPDVPTDVTPTEVQNNAVQSESQTESFLQREQGSKETESTTQEEVTTQSKPKEEQKPEIDPVKIHGDIAQNNPTFVSEQALQTWLQYGSGAYESERSQYLAQSKQAGKSDFYRLSKGIPPFLNLEKIELSGSSGDYTYFCHFEDGSFCNIAIDSGTTSELEEKLYNHTIELCQNKNEGSGVISIKGINFYYDEKAEQSMQIHWKQFDKFHSVSFKGNRDLLDDFVSYLVLEQVTVPLNSDHVTE